MDTQGIIQLLSDNHRLLILLGGVISFISLFLPSWTIQGMSSGWLSFEGTEFNPSISATGLFWIYLILILGLYFGYFRGYGEKYPFLFLGIGVLMLLITIYNTQMYSGVFATALSYGFFLELIGSLAITVGGYYYFQNNKTST